MSEPKFKFDEKDFENDEPNFECDQLSFETYERAKAEKIYLTQIKPRFEKMDKLQKLYNHGKKNKIRFNNLFRDVGIKRKALETIMGYKSLKGFENIEFASEQAVTNAYRRIYHKAKEYFE